MYIYEINRPKKALEDYHPKGTTVTLQLDYSEMILLDHALHSYEREHPDITEDEKYFMWKFIFLRDILKNGTIDSFWCDVHEKMLPKMEDKVSD